MYNKIFIALTIIVYKIAYNSINYFRLRILMSRYEKYVIDKNRNWSIHESKQEIIKLFKGAGIQNRHIPVVEFIDPMNRVRGNIGIFENLLELREGIIHHMHSLFCEAIGVYKGRIFESINPFYWTETAIFLPRMMVKYFGFDENIKNISLTIKILNALYWMTGLLACSSFFFETT